MRVYVVDSGPNEGSRIEIRQDFLFRGTSSQAWLERLEEQDGQYCGSNDKHGLSTLVALNIDGACGYCNFDAVPGAIAAIYDDDLYYRKDGFQKLGDRPLLLAVRHEHYDLKAPEAREGVSIPGLIKPEDIVLVKTIGDLLAVCPDFTDLPEEAQQRILRRSAIF